MVKKTYYKTKDYCKVKFTFTTDGAVDIKIAGLNNNWTRPLEMKKKKDGSFTTEINLPKESTHQFKYIVNDRDWYNEPEADNEAPNEFGGTNSVLVL